MEKADLEGAWAARAAVFSGAACSTAAQWLLNDCHAALLNAC